MPLLSRLAILAIFPLLYFFKGFAAGMFKFLVISVFHILEKPAADYFIVGYIFLLAAVISWTANYFGSNLFRAEYKDHAFEYMMSLPFSRYRLLLYKLIPRTAILFLLTAIYEIVAFIYVAPLAACRGEFFFLVDPQFFPFWVLFLLLSGVFVGLFEQKNWMALVTLIVFYSTVFLSLGSKALFRLLDKGMANNMNESGIALLGGTAIISIILGFGFFLVYRKFDARSLGMYSKRFAMYTLPPFLVLNVISIVLMVK